MKLIDSTIFSAFFLGLLFLSCNYEKPETNKNDSILVDSISNKTKVDTISAIINSSPSELLKSMSTYLDSLGYSCDTTLLKDCSGSNCICKLSLDKHQLGDTINSYRKGYDNVEPRSINRDLLYKAIALYAFPYSVKKRQKGINADGIIEEWIYSNDKDADQAGVEWNRIRNYIFFHTASYITRKKNRIYIFHNRAAFDKIHRETIKRFSGQFDIEYPATIPNAKH